MLQSMKKTPADPLGALIGGVLIVFLALNLHETLGLDDKNMAMLEAGLIMAAAAVRTMINARAHRKSESADG